MRQNDVSVSPLSFKNISSLIERDTTLAELLDRSIHRIAGFVLIGKGYYHSGIIPMIISTVGIVSTQVYAKNKRFITKQIKQPTNHVAPSPYFQPQSLQSSSAQFPLSSSQSEAAADNVIDIQVESQIAFGEDIEVSFTYSKATNQNWIGIFEAGADTSSDSSVALWAFFCGDQITSNCPNSGTAIFRASDPKTSYHEEFPLNPQDYTACIMDQFYEPHYEIACKAFTVMDLPAHAVTNSTLTPSKSSYTFPEPIAADFFAAVPIQNSWIGVYRSSDISEGMSEIPEPLLRVYSACNNQQGDQLQSNYCASKVDNGSVTINTRALPSGRYFLCMSFYSNQPYEKFICSSSSIDVDVSCNTTDVSFFKLEIKTDDYPYETLWELIDINSGEVIGSNKYREFEDVNKVYNEEICIVKDSCYQFSISDEYGDGMCCYYGDGYYKTVFDDTTVLEGGESFLTDVAIFGDGCPTSSPSASSNPSSLPSLSSKPSISQRPSEVSAPSSAPSTKLAINVEYVGDPCTSQFPNGQCTECTGDCDSDSDCAGDLRCAQRRTNSGNENVPGCTWGENSDSLRFDDMDYCELQ